MIKKKKEKESSRSGGNDREFLSIILSFFLLCGADSIHPLHSTTWLYTITAD